MCKAHIPPETAFAMGTQREQKLDKQLEINMPNTTPNARGRDGFVKVSVGSIGVRVGSLWVCIGSARVFGYQHVGSSNAKCSRCGRTQRKATTRMDLHSGGI